jgi:hypothetical protein
MKLVDEGVQKEVNLFVTPSGWRWMLQLNMRDIKGKQDDWWD